MAKRIVLNQCKADPAFSAPLVFHTVCWAVFSFKHPVVKLVWPFKTPTIEKEKKELLRWNFLIQNDYLPFSVCVCFSISQEAYVQKMVKVCNDSDRWSLISLSNNRGKNVELKFVDSLRRQFEFSVDSFQIKLDSLLLFYECSENPMSKTFHPTVIGESVYGDFSMALEHLRNKLICTRNPEEIRGGGLLKYCHLLVRGFRADSESEMKSLQRYMCSRFFIDFPDINEQQRKLESYLQNHFVGLEDRKYDYLMTLHGVVNESTVCLMGHERRQTLGLIAMLAVRVLAEQNVIPNVANVTCYYQPAPYVADANFSNYYIAQVQPVFACQQHTYSTWLPCN